MYYKRASVMDFERAYCIHPKERLTPIRPGDMANQWVKCEDCGKTLIVPFTNRVESTSALDDLYIADRLDSQDCIHEWKTVASPYTGSARFQMICRKCGKENHPLASHVNLGECPHQWQLDTDLYGDGKDRYSCELCGKGNIVPKGYQRQIYQQPGVPRVVGGACPHDWVPDSFQVNDGKNRSTCSLCTKRQTLCSFCGKPVSDKDLCVCQGGGPKYYPRYEGPEHQVQQQQRTQGIDTNQSYSNFFQQ